MKDIKKISGLYLITDHKRGDELITTVTAALRGSISILQYRPKDIPADEALETARILVTLCKENNCLFIINDNPQLAKAVDADGVHLGQNDGTIADARAVLGPGKLIGRSTRTADLACMAEQEGADYIGFGSIYPTGTKSDAIHVGLDVLQEVRSAVKLPIVAIGGIDADGIGAVINAGADAAAVVSAVMNDPQPAIAANELALQFNRRFVAPPSRVMTIAGSDSGGGAGIQADLKTATLLGSYASSVITALTAQNTLGVSAIHAAPLDFVTEQINAVLSDIGTDTIKTGMLHSAELAQMVAGILRETKIIAVVDPVMIAKGGAPLLQEAAIKIVREELIPAAYLVTPNIPEAEALTGIEIKDERDMERAAWALRKLGARNILIKGGHSTGESNDLLLTREKVYQIPGRRIDTANTHGTGCTYAAAIATFLAQGLPLKLAVTRAKAFIQNAIESATPLGAGHGPINHFQAAQLDRLYP